MQKETIGAPAESTEHFSLYRALRALGKGAFRKILLEARATKQDLDLVWMWIFAYPIEDDRNNRLRNSEEI